MEAQEMKFPTFESFKTWFEAKTAQHPFKVGGRMGHFYGDFLEGKAPREFLKEYAKQYYIFIQMTNAYVTWTLLNYIDLWKKHPDLYEIVAAKMGSELSDPAPGGHGRTYLKFARYIGVKDEELYNSRPIPELEIAFNSALVYRSQSPAQTAVRWMLEGFVGYILKHWRETLHEKYGVPDDILEYFDLHVAADLGEHGPEGEMLLEKLYKLGMVREDDYAGMREQVERSVTGSRQGGSQFASWPDVLYARFSESRAA
jgi:pyrroloquinoline quinone (PQQ) biosynthesis protein C